jgi:hypothetical protein
MREQLAFENPAALDEQNAIDGFVRHLHVSIARKGVTKPASDLLGDRFATSLLATRAGSRGPVAK